jgi:hypothetical protein
MSTTALHDQRTEAGPEAGADVAVSNTFGSRR